VVEVDWRKRHKRGRMMRGERDPWSLFWLWFLEDFVLGGRWRKEKGKKESICLNWTHYIWLDLGSEG